MNEREFLEQIKAQLINARQENSNDDNWSSIGEVAAQIQGRLDTLPVEDTEADGKR